MGGFVVSFVFFFPIEATNLSGLVREKKKRRKKKIETTGTEYESLFGSTIQLSTFFRYRGVDFTQIRDIGAGGCTRGVALHSPALAR